MDKGGEKPPKKNKQHQKSCPDFMPMTVTRLKGVDPDGKSPHPKKKGEMHADNFPKPMSLDTGSLAFIPGSPEAA